MGAEGKLDLLGASWQTPLQQDQLAGHRPKHRPTDAYEPLQPTHCPSSGELLLQGSGEKEPGWLSLKRRVNPTSAMETPKRMLLKSQHKPLCQTHAK